MKHAISLSNIFYRASILKLASRISDLKNKYPEYADKIDILARRDPSGNHKYLSYAVKTLVSGKALENEIADVVELFHKYQHKLDNKDINSYKNFTELRDILFDIDAEKGKSRRQEKLEIKTEGGRKIYEDDQCVVIYVKDKAASCFYGSGTKWCITMENHDYFKHYQDENIIFYFILRKDLSQEYNNYKVAVVVYRDEKNKINKIEYFDAMDTRSETPRYTKDLTNWETTLNLITKDAESIPKTIGAKIKNNEATEEELLAEIEKGNYLNTIATFTNNPKIMEKILNHPRTNWSILYGLGTNRNLPPEMFEKILNHPKTNDYVLSYLAKKPNLPPEMFEKILNHPKTNDYSVLSYLAKKPNLPPEMFEKILNHPKTNDYVLSSLAKKPNLPPEMFEKILNHPKTNDYVLSSLAKKPNLPPEMFEKILNHPKVNWFALDAISAHKNLPPELFEKILNHPAANDHTKKLIELQKINKTKEASINSLRVLRRKFSINK